MDDQEIINLGEDELKSLLRTCSPEELPRIKFIIKSNNLLSNRSIGAIIKYRDPKIKELYSNALKGWINRLSPEEFERWRIAVGGERSSEARMNMRLAQLRNRGNLEISRRRSLAQAERFKRDGANNHVSSKYNYWYQLNNEKIYLDSSYELRAIQTYRRRGIILNREGINIRYDYEGQPKTYIPDFNYTDDSGVLHILEVKPKRLINDRAIKKAEITKLAYPDCVFEFITESDLDDLDMNDESIIAYRPPFRKGRDRSWVRPNRNS